MDRSAAEAALADAELVVYGEGPIASVKELERECLAREIPVLLAKGPPKACCGGGGCGCGGKIQVLAREEDGPRIQAFLKEQWHAQAEASGLVQLSGPPAELAEGEEPPCPACGTAAPLKDGACSDCGLVLE